MPIKLEIGKKYREGRGNVCRLGGVTRDYPDIYWSIQGNWYGKDTGYFMVNAKAHHESSIYNLKEEVDSD